MARSDSPRHSLLLSVGGRITMGNKQEKGHKEKEDKGGKGKSKGSKANTPSKPAKSSSERDYVFRILTIGDQGMLF